MNTFEWRLSGPISLAFFIIFTDIKQEFSIWASSSHNPRFLLLMDLILLNHLVLRKCILFLQHLISKVHFRSFERGSAKWFSANDSRDALQGHVASPGAATISLLAWIDSLFLISCLYVFFFQILKIYRLVTLHPHFHFRGVITIFTQFLRMSVIAQFFMTPFTLTHHIADPSRVFQELESPEKRSSQEKATFLCKQSRVDEDRSGLNASFAQFYYITRPALVQSLTSCWYSCISC